MTEKTAIALSGNGWGGRNRGERLVGECKGVLDPEFSLLVNSKEKKLILEEN
ncbi:hypothetical protein ISS42_00630 [Candidatus Shapirobacteria bacterium]|nr:hypothetical protein [Candidatus Shapirobacteria bacterium]